MLSFIGLVLLFSAVNSIFVSSNSKHNFSITTANPTWDWKENGKLILSLSYDNDTDGCNFYPPNTEFKGYCLDNGATYVLEILNTSNHDASEFTGGNKICTIDVTATSTQINATSYTLRVDESVQIKVVVFATKPKPSILVSVTVQNSTKNFTKEETPSCDDALTDYTTTFEISYTKMVELYDEQTFTKELDIVLDVLPYYDDLEKDFVGPRTPNITITFKPEGTTSVTPDTTLSFLHETTTTTGTTSVTPDTTLSSLHETTTATGGTTPDEPCYCYYLIVLIIKAVFVMVFIILVIVHFCRRETKQEGNVYWVINVCLILCALVCFILAIVQILYVERVTACTQCLDKPGHDAAIAFIVLGFIVTVLCIVLIVIRLKQRGQSKDTNNSKPKPTTETNGTSSPM